MQDCNKVNRAAQPIRVSATFNSRRAWSKGQVDSREMTADASNMARMARLPDEMIAAVERRDFRNTNFSCICEHCQSKPAWSFSKLRITQTIRSIALIAAFLALAFLGLAAMDGENLTAQSIALMGLLPASVIFVSTLIADSIYMAAKKRAVNKLDGKYMPIVCKTPKDAEKAVAKIEKELSIKD